jgi:hypothetical protein
MEDTPARATSPRAPVAVLAGAFGLLLLVLLVIILRPSTAPEPVPPAPTGRSPVATAPPQAPNFPDHQSSDRGGGDPGTTLLLDDVDRIRSLMADGFEEDYAPHLSPGEADCLAGAVLEVLGADRLLLLTETMVEASGDPGNVEGDDPALITPSEERELDEQMRPCVDEETASRLNL